MGWNKAKRKYFFSLMILIYLKRRERQRKRRRRERKFMGDGVKESEFQGLIHKVLSTIGLQEGYNDLKEIYPDCMI